MKSVNIMKNPFFIKLFVIFIAGVLLLGAWGYDTARAQKYDIQLVYLSNETPYASQKDLVTFTVRVTRGGKPCINHEISATCSKGQMRIMLARTDEEGYVDFSYAPYNESIYEKAGPVTFEILNLSNSVLIEVHASFKFSITLLSPEAK